MSEKWWDMSDEELDDLFREASDKAEIPFDSSALDKLRQKIDFEPMPTPEPSRGFQKRWIALAGLLFFFGVALLYTFFDKKGDSRLEDNSDRISKNTLPSKIVGEKTTEKNKQSAVINDKNNASETQKSEGNSAETNVNESKIAVNKNSTIAIPTNKSKYVPIDEKEVKGDYYFNKKSKNQKNFNHISENNLLKSKQLDIKNAKSTDEKMPTVMSESNNSTVIRKEKIENEINSPTISYSSKADNKRSKSKKLKINNNQVYNQNIYSETNSSILAPAIIPENKTIEEEKIVKTDFYNVNFLASKPTKSLQTNVESESPTYVDAPPVIIKQPKFSRFGIRLAIAPDINSLEKLSTSVLGSSFGLLLEYRLSKKFILQTGVTYSNKRYVGDFDYYHNWAGNWTAYHPSKPIDVDGGCKIIDVPLNIRFNIYQKPRSTFFISTGVSSYFMMNETYTYDYAWSISRTVSWSDKSSFYWSAFNLSAGMERKLNKHLTFQIEPYLKTPLTNVGRGGVSLYSSGLLFSTKYEF